MRRVKLVEGLAAAALVCVGLLTAGPERAWAQNDPPEFNQLPEEIRRRIYEARGQREQGGEVQRSGRDSQQQPGAPGGTTPSGEDRAREERRERARQEAERRRDARRKEAEERAAALREQNAEAIKRSAQPPPVHAAPSGSSAVSVGQARAKNLGLPTFSLEPLYRQCTVGDVIGVDLLLDNPSGTVFDSLSVAVRYDPHYLRVVGDDNTRVDDTVERQGALRLDTHPESGYINYVDHEQGLIRYAGRFPNNTAISVGGYIWSVSFEAMNPTLLGKETQITFDYGFHLPQDLQHNPFAKPALERGTYLARGTEDFLGDPANTNDGGIFSSFNISDQRAGLNKDREVFIIHDALDESLKHNTRLIVRPVLPESGSIRVGDEFEVDIELENPDGVEFNRVVLFLVYNTRVMEALDADRVESEDGETLGNWVQHGINILDGPYHDEFPFNMFVENQVRLDQGFIHYEVGNQRDMLTSQGTLATCRFRAIAPTARTRLKAFFNRQGRSPTTGVFLHNLDVLGSASDHTDGVVFVPFSILPSLEETSVAQAE